LEIFLAKCQSINLPFTNFNFIYFQDNSPLQIFSITNLSIAIDIWEILRAQLNAPLTTTKPFISMTKKSFNFVIGLIK
jgi:hypothetical protein